MSTVDELNRIMKRLRPTKTVVTNANGETQVEERKEGGEFVKSEEVVDEMDTEQAKEASSDVSKRRQKHVAYMRRCGFVVDLKPDLQIAEVLPHVFMGSQDVAADFSLLKSKNITHIINCATGVNNSFPKHFVYLNIELLDLPDTPIREHFEKIYEFIEDVEKNDGKVFVHCNAGISRSATLVLSYVMRKKQTNLTKSREFVQLARRIHPNTGFMAQLRTYEIELLEQGIII